MTLSPAAPVRLRLSRKKGFEVQKLSRETNGLPARAVTRNSRWGNPFVVGTELLDAGFIANMRALDVPSGAAMGWNPLPEVREWRYALDAGAAADLFHQWILKMQRANRQTVKGWLAPLRGHNLACFCAPRAPCHADILLHMVSECWRQEDFQS